MTINARELRSTVTPDGKLVLALHDVALSSPEPDEVVVRVEATPISPSDLLLLLGPADIGTLVAGGTPDRPTLTFTIPVDRLAGVRDRAGKALAVGNEGAGTVIATGSEATALDGRRVAMLGGGMYADHRKVRASEVVALPDGATAADGASLFVNPLTALGFVETARNDGHKAIVHTAAASNLGQMLQKICLADGIPLVNIVRSPAQVDLLTGIGATHVLDSSRPTFRQELADAVADTGATIAFDAIGGGTLGSDILQAMEQAAAHRMVDYSRYGSPTFKQLHIYGALDVTPTSLNRLSFGFEWSVSGWLLHTFMRKAGPLVMERLRQRVLDELTTTFASHYTRTISLSEALDPEILRAYQRKTTGEKYLIDPSRVAPQE